MSETKNLKLFKHNEPLETNENQFDIKKSLHDNWDKLDEFAGKVNTKTVEIENKQKQHDTDISNIKQEQQDQNSKIENNTTENKDNTELLNQIMGLLPSAKGEGEHVTLQDTGEARFKNFQVQGDSKQETRSGKNKFDINLFTNNTLITDKDSDTGSFKLSNAWASLVMNNTNVVKIFKANTKYKIIVDITLLSKPSNLSQTIYIGSLLALQKAGVPSISILGIDRAIKENWQVDEIKHIETIFTTPNDLSEFGLIGYCYYTDNNKAEGSFKFENVMLLEVTEQDETFELFTTPNDLSEFGLIGYCYYTDNNKAEGSFKFENVMLLEVTEQDETFEPYGASPSPEYPSKIRNVGDDVNLFNGNLSQGYDNNGSIKTSNQFVCNTDLISVRSGGKYTISNNLNKYIVSASYYKDNKFVSFVSNINLKTIEIPNNVNQIRFNLYDNKQLLVSQISILKFEEGTQVTPYSNHNCGNVNFKISNKNLFNPKIISNNSIITVNDDGSVTLANNTNTAGYVSTGKKLSELCKGIKVGDTAYLKLITTAQNNIYLQGKTNQAWFNNNSKKITEDMLEDVVIIYGGYQRTDKSQIQVTKDKLEDYTPNEQQNFTLPLKEGQVLHKGDFLAEDGVHHTRKKIVLDGTEAWGQYNRGTTDFFGVALKVSDIKSGQTIMCNKLIEDGSKIYSTNGEAVGCLTDNYLYICIKRVRIGATINTTFEECLELFKQYLTNCYNKGEPFIIEYGLINEENEPYTPEQQEAYDKLKKLHSYNEQTNIFSKDEISPIFNVEAIKNLNATFAQLSATMLERS